MHDFRLLAWLRWRQWRSSALYWLRTLGYDPQRQGFIDRLYALYLILFGLVWLGGFGLAAVSQAATVGRAVPPAVTQAALSLLPWVIIATAVFLFVRALRSSPVLLSFPDIAYVAASPVSRVAFVLVNFIQSCLQHLIVILPVFALVIVVLAQPLPKTVARYAALRAVAVVAPLILLLLAVAWLLGMLRLESRERRGSGLWWPLAFLLIPLALLLSPLRWPGALLAEAIRGPVPAAAVLALALAAVAAILGLARIAGRANLIAAAEESRTYARLNALGLMAFLAPDVSMRIRRQEALSRRRAYFSLPSRPGWGSLVGRSALLSLRRPTALLKLLLWGIGTAFTAAWLALGQPPLALWFFWVTFLALAPPKMLVESFEADVSDPYLRQLLPMFNGALALAGGIVPLAVAVAGVWVGWTLSFARFGLGTEGWALGLAIGLGGVLIVLLAQAAAAARVGLFGWRPPYAAWLIASIAIVGGAIFAFGVLPGAIVGCILALSLLGLLVAASQPIVYE